MIGVVAYYLGLSVWAFAFGIMGYVTEERERALSGPLGGLFIGYYVLGWYLFGWEVGIANLFVFIVMLVAVAFLEDPIDRLVKTFYPTAEYKWTLSPELRAKLGRVGRRMGFGRRSKR